jgi:hypothetical protein
MFVGFLCADFVTYITAFDVREKCVQRLIAVEFKLAFSLSATAAATAAVIMYTSRRSILTIPARQIYPHLHIILQAVRIYNVNIAWLHRRLRSYMLFITAIKIKINKNDIA